MINQESRAFRYEVNLNKKWLNGTKLNYSSLKIPQNLWCTEDNGDITSKIHFGV